MEPLCCHQNWPPVNPNSWKKYHSNNLPRAAGAALGTKDRASRLPQRSSHPQICLLSCCSRQALHTCSSRSMGLRHGLRHYWGQSESVVKEKETWKSQTWGNTTYLDKTGFLRVQRIWWLHNLNEGRGNWRVNTTIMVWCCSDQQESISWAHRTCWDLGPMLWVGKQQGGWRSRLRQLLSKPQCAKEISVVGEFLGLNIPSDSDSSRPVLLNLQL